MSIDQHVAKTAALPLEEQLAIVSAVWDRLPQYASSADIAKIKAALDGRMKRYRDDSSTAMTLDQF